MFLPAISFSFGQRQISPSQGLQKPQQDFKQIAQSLNAGDLTAAKTALGALQQGLQSVQGSQAVNQTSNSKDTLSADMQRLSQSLQSGDISGAQKAFAILQQDLHSALSSQGAQHHHHGVAASQAAAAYSTNSAATGLKTTAPVNLTA